jgi:hypothetical protein
MRRAALLAATLSAFGGGPATAQSSAAETELRRCRGIADVPARIACYDAIVLPDHANPRPTQVPGANGAAGPASGRATSAPASAPAASAAATVSPPLRDFGLPERPATALPQSIDSVIEGDFDGWTAGARLRLANGQVWEIVDGSTASYRLRDPKVRIGRGLLGSFFISIEGVAQSPRVRRIQ